MRQSFRLLFDTHALVVIALVVFVEEVGIPSPLPGELMMLLAGVKAAQGIYPLWLVLLVQELAALLGGAALYVVCRRAGRPLVLRYGRYVHLHAATLDRAELLIRRRGVWAVAVGRMIPGVCIVVPVAAGVLNMPFARFLASFAVGALGYISALTLFGYVVGPRALVLFERVTLPVGALVALAVLAALLIGGRMLVRRIPAVGTARGRATGAALVAGGYAGFAGLLAANTVVGFARWAFQLGGNAPPLSAAGVGTGWRLLLGWPVFFVIACALGVADGRLLRRGLPYAARTALLGIVPFLLMVLAVYPLAEGHAVRWSQRGFVLLGVEVARWLAFGLALHFVLPPLLGRGDATCNAVTDTNAAAHEASDTA